MEEHDFSIFLMPHPWLRYVDRTLGDHSFEVAIIHISSIIGEVNRTVFFFINIIST